MELTGRITANATVHTTKDDRKVVHFCIAINDSYKPKNSNEVKKLTTYINCSYWQRESIATYLTKGTLVELFGRISVNAWVNTNGEAKASLNFHVSNIKLHGKLNTMNADTYSTTAPKKETAEDLPF